MFIHMQKIDNVANTQNNCDIKMCKIIIFYVHVLLFFDFYVFMQSSAVEIFPLIIFIGLFGHHLLIY